MKVNTNLSPDSLEQKIERLWELSASKIAAIRDSWDDSKGSPVFTAGGRYTTRGWTEWTQGFQYGSALLQFDAGGQDDFLEYGRKGTLEKMAVHLTHMGVHDQ